VGAEIFKMKRERCGFTLKGDSVLHGRKRDRLWQTSFFQSSSTAGKTSSEIPYSWCFVWSLSCRDAGSVFSTHRGYKACSTMHPTGDA